MPNDKDRENNTPPTDDEEQFGWDFHTGPLIVAVVLTIIFYVVVFLLASI